MFILLLSNVPRGITKMQWIATPMCEGCAHTHMHARTRTLHFRDVHTLHSTDRTHKDFFTDTKPGGNHLPHISKERGTEGRKGMVNVPISSVNYNIIGLNQLWCTTSPHTSRPVHVHTHSLDNTYSFRLRAGEVNQVNQSYMGSRRVMLYLGSVLNLQQTVGMT